MLAVLTAFSMLSLMVFAADECPVLSRDYLVLIGEDAGIVNKKIKTDLVIT